MLAKIKRLLRALDPQYPTPSLEEDEQIIREGKVIFSINFYGGGRVGRMRLTNRRFQWYEVSKVSWPFKRIIGEARLADIESVDKGTLVDFVFGGTRLRLRLRDGRDKRLIEGDGKLDEWIEAVRSRISA